MEGCEAGDGPSGANGGSAENDIPSLSEHALAALAEFYAEQNTNEKENLVKEDWQLSQFWYSKETADTLVAECFAAISEGESIACVSCPTLMDSFLADGRLSSEEISLKLLEYDSRFAAKYPAEFVQYDYRNPLDVPAECRHGFDLIVADPPFLSDECFVKVAQTVRLLSRSPATKIIVCTGAVMEPMIERLFGTHRCAFKPIHRRNLANEFACFANYQTTRL